MQSQAGAPRGEYFHSNGGYVVAATMLEQVMDAQWEDLVVTRVFQPLGMFTAGFGSPGRAGSFLQPWGHALESGSYRAVEPGPGADIPEALGPAGTVHLSMDDYGKFAAAHIAGARGVDGLVSAATFARLHQQAPNTASGLGWLLGVRAWANGIALHHEGSNQLWYANVWLAPERDFGLLAVTNGGQERAFRTTEETVSTLIERFDAAQVP
jgi:CubicO group peptidase (beta-lactamase class C family)